MGRQAPPKLADVQAEVRRLLDAGFYFETKHARIRMKQLGVSADEVRYVLRSGLRDPSRDEYEWESETWKYVVHGRPPAGEKSIRIAFAISYVPPLPNTHTVVITVILLSRA